MSSHPHRRHDDNVQYARSIDGGKKNSKAEARISDDLKEAFRRKWMDAGFESESECAEMLIAVFTWGQEHVRTMQEQRLRRVSFMSDNAQPSSSFPGI